MLDDGEEIAFVDVREIMLLVRGTLCWPQIFRCPAWS
ncbi:MAG: hypothetical protein ACI9W2_003167 [Gammaproteobacteria bacterium]|jgi:hypothetical protein